MYAAGLGNDVEVVGIFTLVIFIPLVVMGILFPFEALGSLLSLESDIAMVYTGMKSLRMSGIFLLRSRLSSGVGLVIFVLFVGVCVEGPDMEECGSVPCDVCPGLENWEVFPSLW